MDLIPLQADGPFQNGRGVRGQYVYWITMPMPKPETVATHGVKTPAEYSREQFIELGVAVHAACGHDVLEAACFQEPHADGQPHLNLLVRCSKQFRWLAVGKRYLEEHKVHVNFAPNIKTWMDGVVYGKVASEHKSQDRLDQGAVQWAKNGQPTPFEQFLPARWQEPGFVRKTKLTSLAFHDLCVEHRVQNDTELWATAAALSAQGDRGMLAYMLDNDGEAQFAKVLKATNAKEQARRAGMTREELLVEYFDVRQCTCQVPGHCDSLMKQVLVNNGLDGRFQKEVFGSLSEGRLKMRNICLVGGTNCGKSFLLKGLMEIYKCYKRPDGGTHQLEELLGKEAVFLNDFEFDTAAKSWMTWQYFKDFLEGGAVTVACPKTRGSNKVFEGDAPVFLTAPKEITFYRYGQEVKHETKQMRKRICYLEMTHEILEEEYQEVKKVCGHCSAKLYLEGRVAFYSPETETQRPPQQEERGQPAAKRPRTAQECVGELVALKGLLDAGALSEAEFTNLKTRLLQGA